MEKLSEEYSGICINYRRLAAGRPYSGTAHRRVRMKKLLVGRQASGFGGWIMLSACMQMINMQRPDIRIYLYNAPYIPERLLTLPFLCGVHYELTTCVDNFDYVVPHVVYDVEKVIRSSEHLCKSMLDCIRVAGVDGLVYDKITRVRPTTVAPSSPGRPYVVMPSVGATHSDSSKNWPYLRELAIRLHQDYDIIQVGMHGDPALPYSTQYYKPSYTTLSHIYSCAAFAVSLENGLSHWAGHHDKRSYTIYTGKHWCTPAHAWYPTQIPIQSRDFAVCDADTVYRVIMEHECTNKAIKPVVVL